ncbi:YjfI family protein [Pseudomonas sp. HK3]
MNIKSSAHYQREYRKRLRDQGLVKKEVWILPENARQLSFYEKRLRELIKGNENKGVEDMMVNGSRWETPSLYKALSEDVLFHSGKAKVELIEGVEQALYITMGEYGDLPVFLTVSGDQLVVEAVLWPVAEVKDLDAFNDAILRTQKYFPLSSISLDGVEGDNDYYYMFGALSSKSLLTNVVFEIEMLATNVIQAAEVYGEFLSEEIETV